MYVWLDLPSKRRRKMKSIVYTVPPGPMMQPIASTGMSRLRFAMMSTTNANNIETDTCIEMWKMWLPGKCGFLDAWFNFLVNVKKPNVIKKDQWIQFFELCRQTNGDFSKFSDVDDGTWPEIIDDFNEHMNPS